jgi:hypothetical protein
MALCHFVNLPFCQPAKIVFREEEEDKSRMEAGLVK